MPTNDFLPFSATDTGTNLLSQADYIAAANRPIGNQPGVASSKLVNKALRQPTYIASQLAQLIANVTNTDVLDDATPAKLLAQMTAALLPLPSVRTVWLNTGTHYTTYYFFIASGSATVGATYTNNSQTFTVKATVASGTLISMTGTGAPSVNGTLTKASGTGDATLTFFAARAPVKLRIRAQGGGGGGAGSGTSNPSGGNGGDTTFASYITAQGGGAGTSSGNATGGGTSFAGPAVGFGIKGGDGACGQISPSAANTGLMGGPGASSPFGGGGGAGSFSAGVGTAASPNSGSGGGGGGTGAGVTAFSGNSGAAGGYAEADLPGQTAASYAVTIGAAGAAGSAGGSGFVGGAGAKGIVIVDELF